MKKSFLILSLSLIVVSCKNDNDHKISLSKRFIIDESNKYRNSI